MPDTFHDDATDSFLGYLYQVRFGLLGGLKLRDPLEAVAIELLDDVSFATPSGQPDSLHQLKHSLVKKASLGAKSVEVWKTLGNWATKVTEGVVDLKDLTLFLHTTGRVSRQNPLSNLMIRDRNEQRALNQLCEAGSSSRNSVIQTNAAKFDILAQTEQLVLLERLTVIDNAANIVEAAAGIEQLLAISSRPETLAIHRQSLEGWFFDRVIQGMTGEADKRITAQEIRNQSTVIRDRLVQDYLPDLDDSAVPDSEISEDDSRCFVRQLRLIGAASTKVRRAQTEHFQALTQRSRWSREGLLAVEELPKFDRRLLAEWEIRHEAACLNSKDGDEQTELEEAANVYRWVEEHAPGATQLYIRKSFTEPYLIRGSYHMLADRRFVGWHPRFAALLAKQ